MSKRVEDIAQDNLVLAFANQLALLKPASETVVSELLIDALKSLSEVQDGIIRQIPKSA